jgi:hypothetical protein
MRQCGKRRVNTRLTGSGGFLGCLVLSLCIIPCRCRHAREQQAMPKKYEKRGPIRKKEIQLRDDDRRAISGLLGVGIESLDLPVAESARTVAEVIGVVLNRAGTYYGSFGDKTAWLPSDHRAEHRNFIEKPAHLMKLGFNRAKQEGTVVVSDFDRRVYLFGDSTEEDDERFDPIENSLIEHGISRSAFYEHMHAGWEKLGNWYKRHPSPGGNESKTYRAIAAKDIQKDFSDLYTWLCRELRVAGDESAREGFVELLFSMAVAAAQS